MLGKNISLGKLFSGKKSEKKQFPKFSLKPPKKLIVIEKPKDQTKTDVRYSLIENFASAHIKWDSRAKKLVYKIEEPKLTKEDKKLLEKIEKAMTELIDVKMSAVKNTEEAIDYIMKKMNAILEDMGITLSNERYLRMMYYMVRDFVGLNEIEPLMHDPYIEDIGCSGLKTPVYSIHRRFGSLETSINYDNLDYLSNFVIKIAERCGRYISYATPLLDGSLPDGSRVQASFAKDVTTKGPTFTIRKFRKNPFSPVDTLNLKTLSVDMLAYLWLIIQHNVSILICGGVSTGKTTFLNVLSMFIPPEHKIISIEDTREINLPHDNWIPSVSRTGFGIPEASGRRYGEVNLFELLKESFRQNPDYVVVGEIRGKEAYVMFQGMASGHPSMGTIHAGSLEDVMKRLETPPIELSPSLIDSLDVLIIMVNAKEKGKSARRIKEILEIQSVDPRTGTAHTNRLFNWVPLNDNFEENLSQSDLLQKISFEEGVRSQEIKKELEQRKSVLEWLRRHNLVQYQEVCRIINLYHKEKNTVLDWVKKDKHPQKLV